MQQKLIKNALIGYSGFVGSTLLKQSNYDSLYNSKNIHEIDGRVFDTVVCAGAPAQKWIANQEPEADLKNIAGLIRNLKSISCKTFVLISTVDVFKNPVKVDEGSEVDEMGLHSYGANRFALEKFVQNNFAKYLIVRLPGLVGPGLRKNIIFDFLNENQLSNFDHRSTYQFYPMVNLWHDIQIALRAGLDLIHLTAEPVSVGDISVECFGKPFEFEGKNSSPIAYDMQTQYANLFGGFGDYQYKRRESFLAIRSYAQSEPVSLSIKRGRMK